jgi:hypothetical protein
MLSIKIGSCSFFCRLRKTTVIPHYEVATMRR